MGNKAVVKPWPAATIEMVKVTDLSGYKRNVKSHPPEQIAALKASMLKNGWTNPLLRRQDNTLIAGHGRLQAALELFREGATEFEEAPVMTAVGWSEAECRAYAIADNKLAEGSAWDFDALRLEITEIATAENIDWGAFGIEDFILEVDATEGTYGPVVDPTTAYGTVTQEDVDNARDRLGSAMADRSGQDLLSVVCPHCAQEFKIRKDAL